MSKILNINDEVKLNIDSTNIKNNYVLQPKEQIIQSGADLNNYTTPGMYRFADGITNLPSENYHYGQMLVIYGGSDTGMQLAFAIGSLPPAWRYWTQWGSFWSSWYYLSQTSS